LSSCTTRARRYAAVSRLTPTLCFGAKMSYEKEWDDLKKRRLYCWIALITYAPGAYFLGTAIERYTGSNIGFLIIALAWMIACAILGFRYAYWICPRCKEYYFSKAGLTFTFINRCTSCGLEKWPLPGKNINGA
ncbi:MAG: hypothetical protein OEV87_12960, partial [Phycisphaerae bacterium]|nr:hypothetical protein [Phycisphaerae bacterium]